MNTPPSTVHIDWSKFWNFLYRFATGVGLVSAWILLLGLVIFALIWVGISISHLSFAWMLGIGITTPIVIVCWWLSYHVAVDALSDFGIELTGFWQWTIIPIALPLAPLLFLLGSIAGIGELIQGKAIATTLFAIGLLLILFLGISVAKYIW